MDGKKNSNNNNDTKKISNDDNINDSNKSSSNNNNNGNNSRGFDVTTNKSNELPTVQILIQNLSTVIPESEFFAKSFPKKIFLFLSIIQIFACAMAFNSHIFIIISTKKNFRSVLFKFNNLTKMFGEIW